jgi:hypothetical protein
MIEAMAPSVGAHVRHTHCLFQEDWWLEAVAPGAWAVATVGQNSDLQARLPYVLTRRPFFSSIRQPNLTQTLGPWYRDVGGRTISALGREHQLAAELVAQLPRTDFFSMNFHHEITNWLPYTWQQFEMVPKVTYVLEKLGSEENLWEGLAPNIRREIRKAGKRVEVVRSDDLDLFVRLNQKTFERQQMMIPYSPKTLRRVHDACGKRGAGHIYFARDADQRYHAAIYVVHDERSAFYLLGGADASLRTSGAHSLLMWNAMLDASRTSRQFNFEGSVIQGIERFLRAFGGEQKTYMNVRRANWKGAFAVRARDALRSFRSSGSD